jgi:hypothetical protein
VDSKFDESDPIADAPARFVADLSEALRRGMDRGRLDEDDLDPLVHAPDFDPGAFDAFLESARAKGIALPEVVLADAPEIAEGGAAATATATAAGPLGRGALDMDRRYLKDVQRSFGSAADSTARGLRYRSDSRAIHLPGWPTGSSQLRQSDRGAGGFRGA